MHNKKATGFGKKCITMLQSCAIAFSLSTVIAVDTHAVEGKFLPKDGKKLLLIGQDNDSVRGYTSDGRFPDPGGITNYTNAYNMLGVTETFEYGSGPMNMQEAMDMHPNSALSIGFFMSEILAYDRNTGQQASNGMTEIVQGRYDANFEKLANFAKSYNPRPIFLRIGYEFDGPWNGYDPEKYKNAYRYIVDYMNNAGVTNIAYVWQSANWVANPNGQTMNWYPGDDYVDWIGISFFFFAEGESPNGNSEHYNESFTIARDKNKPVMIAETSAQHYDFTDGTFHYWEDGRVLESFGEEGIWKQYFEDQLIELIDKNSDVIRAMAWINADWRNQPQWACCGGGFWGDTRIEETQTIANNWLNMINDGTWVHGSPSLLNDLGIEDAPVVATPTPMPTPTATPNPGQNPTPTPMPTATPPPGSTEPPVTTTPPPRPPLPQPAAERPATATPNCIDGSINFNNAVLGRFGNQDIRGEQHIVDDGCTLILTGNSWKIANKVTHTMKPTTVLEFEYYSEQQGEIQGILFDTENPVTGNGGRTFNLSGTDDWGIRDYTYTTPGQYQTVRIPVGLYFGGFTMYIGFANDDDKNHNAITHFRNVRLIDE